MRFLILDILQATAIFQAKQKLTAIDRANRRPVSSEDLIKFAHRISASNAVCAPLNWQQGDLRRPYPTGQLLPLPLLFHKLFLFNDFLLIVLFKSVDIKLNRSVIHV